MRRFSYVGSRAVALVLVVMAVTFSGGTRRAEAQVACNPTQLSPCLPAITSSTPPPSETCCTRLREQTSCFCGYLRDPSLRQFADNPNTRKIASSCGVPYPQC